MPPKRQATAANTTDRITRCRAGAAVDADEYAGNTADAKNVISAPATKRGQPRAAKRKAPEATAPTADDAKYPPSPAAPVPKRAKGTVKPPVASKKLPNRKGRNVNPASRQQEYDRAKPGERAAEKAAELEAKAAKAVRLRAEAEAAERELELMNAREDEDDTEIEKTYNHLSAAKRKRAEYHEDDTSGEEFGSALAGVVADEDDSASDADSTISAGVRSCCMI